MTQDFAKLAECLRAHVQDCGGLSRDAETGEIVLPNGAWAMMLSAATALESLSRDLAEARAALEPMAAMDARTKTGHAFDAWADSAVIFDIGKDRKITAGDLRRARSVLPQKEAADE